MASPSSSDKFDEIVAPEADFQIVCSLTAFEERSQKEKEEVAQRIYYGDAALGPYRKLLCTLLMTEEQEMIDLFIREGMSDDCLPLLPDNKERLGGFGMRCRIHGDAHKPCLQPLKPMVLKIFHDFSRILMPACITWEPHAKHRHYVLEEDDALPMVIARSDSTGEEEALRVERFADVLRVKIDPSGGMIANHLWHSGLFDNSDAESEISDIESLVFSTASGDSDETALTSKSLSITRQAAAQLLAKTLSKDRELEALYRQAGAQLSQGRFFVNHSRLLKAFFQDLRNEAQNHTSDRFPKATYYLQSRRQREKVTSGIWYQFASFFAGQQEPSHVVEGLVPNATTKTLTPIFNDAAGVIRLGQSLSAEDDIESEESEDETKGNNQPDPSEEINYLLGLFTEGPAFEAFKSGLKSFLNPPNSVEEAVGTNNPVVIRRYIRRHFDEIVAGDYPWVKELRDIGLTDDEIARILLDQAVDAPWIFFEPQDVDSGVINENHHIPGCMISGIPRLIQALCGLAGVAPISRDRGKWNGSVCFLGTEQREVLECQVSIVSPVELNEELPASAWSYRITRALERLYTAVSRVQAASLCCNSLTMLLQSKEPGALVEMRRIYFSSINNLLHLLAGKSGSWETPPYKLPQRESFLLLEILSEILVPLFDPDDFPKIFADSAPAVLHYSALGVQMFCLAFLSYIQGHTRPLQPFFLDTAVDNIVLCGIEPRLADRYGAVEAQFKSLSCVGDMLGGPVLCFSLILPGTFQHKRAVDSSVRYDLLASTEDMIDTLGPGNLMLSKQGPDILGIHLGGGVISVDTSGENSSSPPLCHWSPYRLAVEDSSNPKGFHPGVPIRVGAAITENPLCIRDENDWWIKSLSYEESQDLGTHHAHWIQAERQLMGQGGQYAVVSANVVWIRVQAHTLKQRKLESADKELVPFSDDPFGVQVSFCTGVSRRVTLRNMLADLMPVFADASLAPDEIAAWTALRDAHSILDLFRADTGNIRNWLITPPDASLREYAMTLIRDILSKLQHTGFNLDTERLNIA
ncbi:hypothetical protein B0H63DRAFT_552590 [Podospora didyma]|uniref:Uncharacterized protein n=1 Tax=Podospora didyma TaxID=330526 RepID=A0AAE0N542_9PEZI|nr:hypothetical protein B0H63DRAFT_552590 [Podospora didyma]